MPVLGDVYALHLEYCSAVKDHGTIVEDSEENRGWVQLIDGELHPTIEEHLRHGRELICHITQQKQHWVDQDGDEIYKFDTMWEVWDDESHYESIDKEESDSN